MSGATTEGSVYRWVVDGPLATSTEKRVDTVIDILQDIAIVALAVGVIANTFHINTLRDRDHG